MIRVSDLLYTYPRLKEGDTPPVALDGVSFTVNRGTCLGVLGANNSGKTTLCLAVAGLAPRLTEGKLSGVVLIDGHDMQSNPPGQFADIVGLVMQDPVGQLFNATVEDEIAWGLENLGLPPRQIRERVESALASVGLDAVPRDQPPQTLSGGQQKRLALAAALALEPQVLILDEPAGGLSPAGRNEMVRVLQELRASQGLTILLTSADPVILHALSDTMLVLEDGRIRYSGVGREILHLPGVPTTPAGQFAAVVNAESGGSLTCLSAVEAVEQASQIAIKYPPDMHAPVDTQKPRIADPVIQIENLSFAYEPAKPVLQDVNITIDRGQVVALTGENGAGKTTLAKHLVGLVRPGLGQVRVFGESTGDKTVGVMARKVGLAFQNPELQIFNVSVRDELAYGPRRLWGSAESVDRRVNTVLAMFDLASVADVPPAVLSFSQRRMVALGAIAAMDTPILVLDEPTVGLDADGLALVSRWIHSEREDGKTVLLITHDMELAASLADRIIVMNEGQVVCDGPPLDVFTRMQAPEAYGLELPFAVGFARGYGMPGLAADLTPSGVARAWMEACL